MCQFPELYSCTQPFPITINWIECKFFNYHSSQFGKAPLEICFNLYILWVLCVSSKLLAPLHPLQSNDEYNEFIILFSTIVYHIVLNNCFFPSKKSGSFIYIYCWYCICAIKHAFTLPSIVSALTKRVWIAPPGRKFVHPLYKCHSCGTGNTRGGTCGPLPPVTVRKQLQIYQSGNQIHNSP